MADTLSKRDRSKLMSRIRSKDTKPELIVRSCVHRLGYRFRLHDRSLPGSPDLVLRQICTVIFVHGCFWHRHEGCKYCYSPKSRVRFWNQKFKATIARDKRAIAALSEHNWRTVVVWECETDDLETLAERINLLLTTTPTSHCHP